MPRKCEFIYTLAGAKDDQEGGSFMEVGLVMQSSPTIGLSGIENELQFKFQQVDFGVVMRKNFGKDGQVLKHMIRSRVR